MTVLTILFKGESCCRKRSDEKNENEINEKNENEKKENDENDEVKILEKSKDFLGSLMKYSLVLEKLKKIAEKNFYCWYSSG